jgi:undecaprenyl-diphosphatase
MTLLEAIFLGIIQGATEFLPISSSGHSILLPTLFNMPNPGLGLIAIAHQGTLLAVLIYFWRDLWRIFLGMLDGLRRRAPLAIPDSRLGWYILAGSIPAAVAGLLLEGFFEAMFGRPIFAAAFLLVTAVLLLVGERLLSGSIAITEMNGLDALAVGIFQMLALFPGISRSGSTIAGGLWRGLNREAAARFSFLLGVPAIAGAGLLAVLDIRAAGLNGQLEIYAATFAAAAISGYLCIHFLLTWLKNHSLVPFAVYCAAFGLFYILLAVLQVI